MIRSSTIICAVALVACGSAGGPLDAAGDDLTVAGNIAAQSLTHGNLTAAKPSVAYAFNGKAGDVIAPDVWPTASSALDPTLVLLGPKTSTGHRAAIAAGAPRGADQRHLAIDGFTLPKTGSYLVVVGAATKGATGEFSLRLWMQSSHFPRQEGSQVDLALVPSPVATAAVQAHATSPHPWTDGEVDGVIADMLQQGDVRVAVSSAQGLLSALAVEECNDAQRSRAVTGAAQIVGTLQHFRSLDPQIQAFALWWLGNANLLFDNAPAAAAPQGIADTVSQLVAAWPGAQEYTGSRNVQVRALNGVVYGWQADWSAAQTDVDGTEVWFDSAREWFDPSGNWLGEQSAGASEPDDD